jgi:hypothetical protein
MERNSKKKSGIRFTFVSFQPFCNHYYFYITLLKSIYCTLPRNHRVGVTRYRPLFAWQDNRVSCGSGWCRKGREQLKSSDSIPMLKSSFGRILIILYLFNQILQFLAVLITSSIPMNRILTYGWLATPLKSDFLVLATLLAPLAAQSVHSRWHRSDCRSRE